MMNWKLRTPIQNQNEKQNQILQMIPDMMQMIPLMIPKLKVCFFLVWSRLCRGEAEVYKEQTKIKTNIFSSSTVVVTEAKPRYTKNKIKIKVNPWEDGCNDLELDDDDFKVIDDTYQQTKGYARVSAKILKKEGVRKSKSKRKPWPEGALTGDQELEAKRGVDAEYTSEQGLARNGLGYQTESAGPFTNLCELVCATYGLFGGLRSVDYPQVLNKNS